MNRRFPAMVYFLRRTDGEGPVKIGCSQAPADRLASIAQWSPYPLSLIATLPGDEKLEGRFHALFRSQHSHREWFHPSSEMDAVIASVVAGTFDIDSLPSRVRLTARVYKPWSDFVRRRFKAQRALRALRAGGVVVPSAVMYPAWYNLSPEGQAAAVDLMIEFLADHAAKQPNPSDTRRVA